MPASEPRAGIRSEHTLDCHTDAIILREGAAAVCSTYLRRSSSSLSVATETPTPTTECEPPPGAVRPTTFRAAPTFIVGEAPATARARARAQIRASAAGAERTTKGHRLVTSRRVGAPSWVPAVGAFAIGATTAASGGVVADRALEIAVIACVTAGLVLLAAARARGRG